MFDDLGALFMNSVVAAYDDYVAKRDATKSGRDKHLRAAIELATALFHFREHLPAQLAKSRKDVETACPDYRLIADVANAAKHAQLTNPTPQGAPLVTSANDVQEVIATTLYEDAEGTYSDSQTFIYVKCTDGTNRNLDAALTNVLNYWSDILLQAGIVKYPQVLAPLKPGGCFVARKDAKSPDLEILNTIRFRGTIQVLKFDPAKGYAEPMDLSGASAVMRIYKPTNIIDITAALPGHREVTIPVQLSDDQAIALHRMKSDTEKQAFMQKVFESRAEEIFKKVATALQEKAAQEKPEG